MGLKAVHISPWTNNPLYAVGLTFACDATTAGDVAVIGGITTVKSAAIHRIVVSGTATAATVVNCSLILRSTASTGGTSTGAGTPVSLSGPTFVATIGGLSGFTANPTAGTAIGTVCAQKLLLSTPATQPVPAVFDFTPETGLAPLVMSSAQLPFLYVNFGNAATLTGGSVSVYALWSEF